MKRLGLKLALVFIALDFAAGAASLIEAAPFPAVKTRTQSLSPQTANQKHPPAPSVLPHPVLFREVKERGLLVRVWVNETGPYTFAIDTGAGITLIGNRVAASARTARHGSSVSVGGLSGVSPSNAENGRDTIIRTLAVGDPANLLPANQKAIVIDNLPSDIDGILDPTEAYFPFGCSIDLPNHEMAAFNPKTSPLSINSAPEGGTVVRWIRNGSGRRPFVRLGDGRLALLDTGSGFGLAVSQDFAPAAGRPRGTGVHDIGGGEVISKRVDPSTVSIGSLILRGVPTDILYGVEKEAPVLLGRDALYPFRLTFDPLQRLIEIAPPKR